MLKIFSCFTTLLITLTPSQAQAYIGPGMGLGVAAMVMGLFVAFILLIVGMIWLPIRRILRQRKEDQESPSNPPSP
jgi:hypothetical protein